ncbi:MAG: hypothetical protein HC875_35105 [Anaerolineales bacterium]|nr:hypothetical protein [Anaerolineales bacterium]
MSITHVHFSCALQGDDFDPTPFLDNGQLKITDYHLRGSVDNRKGREGRIFQDGYILLQSKDGNFEEFIHKLYSIKELIIGNKADRRVVYVDLWYEGYCHWEVEPNLLKMMGELDLTLATSSIEEEENEDNEMDRMDSCC